MTELKSALETLMSIESEADDFDDLKRSARELTGIEIDGLYCLHTGKLIGRFDRLEIQEAIFEEGDCDQEELIDSLIVRVVASMRPSPALNKPDMGTIREMSQRRPVDCLAYLVNRLYGNQNLLRYRTDDAFTILRARIEIHSRITALWKSGIDLAPFIHWLLEIDSKMNLHTVAPPTFDIFESLEQFENWVFGKLSEARILEAKALSEVNWHLGNRLTRAATIQSHLDNPDLVNRKMELMKRPLRGTEGNHSKPVRKAKESKVDQFMGLLDDIINKAGSASTTTVTHKRPKPMTAGMLFKKKES